LVAVCGLLMFASGVSHLSHESSMVTDARACNTTRDFICSRVDRDCRTCHYGRTNCTLECTFTKCDALVDSCLAMNHALHVYVETLDGGGAVTMAVGIALAATALLFIMIRAPAVDAYEAVPASPPSV
jgi:hypothetical protein